MGRTCQIVSVESARKNSDDVRSGILIEVCPEHIKAHIHLNLTRLPDYASVRSEIETFLEARQSSSNPDAMDIGSLNGQKGVVAIVDKEVVGRQVVPNVARVMARDRARKASQAKAKLMMAKEKAKVASGKHAKHLMGTAITVGNGDTWKMTVSSNPRVSAAKAKVQAVLMNLRKMDQRTLQLADSVCAHFETIVMTGSGKNCRIVTFTLDSGAAVSAAPKSLGGDYPMQIEEPRSYKTATGSLVQDEGFRVLPIVTEEGCIVA